MSANLTPRVSRPTVNVNPDPGVLSKMFSAIGKFFTAPLRFSLAGRAGCALFLFLLVLVVVVWLLLFLDPNAVIWGSYMSAGRMLLVAALVIVTPLVVYYSLRLWLEGDRSQFPDIDYAWKSGVEALRANGISMTSTPIFLILGSTQESQERALLQASGLRFRVDGVPEGPAALHWYANPEAIFLFCTETSLLSAFNAHLESGRRGSRRAAAATTVPAGAPAAAAASPPATEAAASTTPPPEPPAAPSEGAKTGETTSPSPGSDEALAAAGGPDGDTMAPGSLPPRSSGGKDNYKGTIVLDSFVDDGPAPAGGANPPAPSPESKPAPPGGSGDQAAGDKLVLSPDGQPAEPAPSAPAPAPAPVRQPSPGPSRRAPALESGAALSAQETHQQTQRLQALTHLLRLARQPLCPVNGVLTLLPFEAVQAAPADVQQLERAVKSDLTTIQRELQVRSPVSAMVVDLEYERGFRELVRRVGRDRAAIQRFGRRYDVRAEATPEDLRALSAHVCGAFEDWIYTLFREHGSLSRPGNTRLYSLLCKVRCTLKPRLSGVLGEGYGYDPRFMSDDDRIPFSGCYFAATGSTGDRQAFVRGVFDKLVDEQEQVEWTSEALRSERRYRHLAALGIVVDLLLIASIGAIFFLW